MAWIRTSTSLIAFGFTIFKFFQYLASADEVRRPVSSPWLIGLLMIVVGLTALVLAWIQHHVEMKALKTEFGPTPYSLSSIMAALIAALGLAAFVMVLLRL